MFTETIDRAVMRVIRDGVEYAATYDVDACNPLESFSLKGIAIERNERNSMAYNPDGVMGSYNSARDELDNAVDALEYEINTIRQSFGDDWWNHIDEETDEYLTGMVEDIVDCERNLKSYHVFTYKETALHGAPEFEVVVDTELFKESWGDTEAEWEDIYKGLAMDYAYWAEGEVYGIGYTDAEGNEDTIWEIMGYEIEDDNKLVTACNMYLR